MSYTYNILKDGITQSQIKNYLSCRRYFYLSLIRGWTQSKLSKSIILGICFHRCCELWYGALDKPVELEDMTDHVLEEYEGNNNAESWSLEQQQDFEEVGARLHPLFPAYVKWWSKRDAKFKWLALEHVFRVPLPVTLRNGDAVVIPITGMIDGGVQFGKDRRIFETKTKGRINLGGITNTLLHDFQVNMYLWAANQERPKGDPRYGGVIYNLVHTSGLKETKTGIAGLHLRISEDVKKNPAKYFIRLEKVITTKQEKAFGDNLVRLVGEIASFVLLDGGKEEHRFCGPCLGQYGQCDLLGMCYDSNAAGLEKRTAVHPELEES